MGWASGSDVAKKIITSGVVRKMRRKNRLEFYRVLIEALEDQDCDTLQECIDLDPVFEEAYEEMQPLDDYEGDQE